MPPLSRFLVLVFHLAVLAAPTHAAPVKPKYGPEAVPLAIAHDYFRRAQAPDYWALAPYYAAQQTDSSCSAATVVMIVNAARAFVHKANEETLVTENSLLKKVNDGRWQRAVRPGGEGVTPDALADSLRAALRVYGFPNATVELHQPRSASSEELAKLKGILRRNEKSADDFVVLNFLQGSYTDDAMVGHFAPLAAYDARHGKALVMDPDREWYEPYWVSLETLLKGVATFDKDYQSWRGYLWIRLNGR